MSHDDENMLPTYSTWAATDWMPGVRIEIKRRRGPQPDKGQCKGYRSMNCICI